MRMLDTAEIDTIGDAIRAQTTAAADADAADRARLAGNAATMPSPVARAGRPDFAELITRLDSAFELGQRLQDEPIEKRRILQETIELSPEGVAAQLRVAGQNFLSTLERVAADLIGPTEHHLTKRREELEVLPTAKDPAASAVLQVEWRRAILDIPNIGTRADACRQAIEAGEETAYRALLTAPAVIFAEFGLQREIRSADGVVQQPGDLERMRERWIELRSGAAGEELSQLQGALRRARASLAAAERVVMAVCFPDSPGGHTVDGDVVRAESDDE